MYTRVYLILTNSKQKKKGNKMKFTVEVDDFWIEERELSDALQSDITRSVVSQISKSIKDKVDKCLTEKINGLITAKLEASIEIHIENMLNSGEITKQGSNISIVEHMRDLFNKDRGWSSLDSHVKKYSEKFAKDMIIQYDALFANKIVLNMKDQGLLREDVVNNLLGRD